MYIFKKLWICYMMFARNKGKKLYRFMKCVNLFSACVVKYYMFKLSFNTYAEYGVNIV